MTLLLVQGLGSLLALLVFVALGARGRNPVSLIVSTVREGFASPGGRLAILAISGVIVLNYVEGVCDPALTRWLAWDATPAIQRVEGDLVGRLQAWTPSLLTLPLAVVYVPGYLAMLSGAPGDLGLVRPSPGGGPLRDRVRVQATRWRCRSSCLFPFARSAGAASSTARPLLDGVWPGITAELRAGSPLDNCFPSMHVSCVVTALWYSHRYGPPRLRRLAWVVAPAIAWSTMALGIHWAADVVAGVLVAVACCTAADRAGLGFQVERRGDDAVPQRQA